MLSIVSGAFSVAQFEVALTAIQGVHAAGLAGSSEITGEIFPPTRSPTSPDQQLHGTLSGGEKAIVLHLPLFAALAAHYEAAPTAPRLVLLDEVFVGIDPSNRGQLLDLLRGFDLDAVLTSDHEWRTDAELDGIAIHQLLTDDVDKAVTTARFIWTGTALEQADLPEPTPEPTPEPDPITAGTLFDS